MLRKLLKWFLISCAVAAGTLLAASKAFSQLLSFELVRLEEVSWHADVKTVDGAIERLRHSRFALFLSPKERARVQGLLGDREWAWGRKEAALEYYTKELLGWIKASNAAAFAKLQENPGGLSSCIAPATPPASLPRPAPFNADMLIQHAPPDVPPAENAHEAAAQMPEIQHFEELHEILQAGPNAFSAHASRAAELLRINEEAIAASTSLTDRYHHYRCPANSEHLHLNRAAELFLLQHLASWRASDGPGMVESHRRALQIAGLIADDGSLVTALVHIALRNTIAEHGEAMLSQGLPDHAMAAGLRRNFQEFPFNRSFLHRVAAREFLSSRAMALDGLDQIVPYGEGLGTVINFREQWIRDYDEMLFAQMSLLHASLTELGRADDFHPVRPEAIFADALHSVRPAFYCKYPHSTISEEDAIMIRTYAASRCSAQMLACIGAPNTGRIMAAVAELEESEAALVHALSTSTRTAQPYSPGLVLTPLSSKPE